MSNFRRRMPAQSTVRTGAVLANTLLNAGRFLRPFGGPGWTGKRFPQTVRATKPNMIKAQRQEVKQVDNAQTFASFTSATPGFALLNAVNVGSNIYQRTGVKIALRSIHIRGIITPSRQNGTAVTEQLGRIIVVYDKQPNGAGPAMGDVLQTLSNAGAATTTSYSMPNLLNRERFTILRDKKVFLSPLGINGATPASTTAISLEANTGQNPLLVDMFIKLTGLETSYNTNTSGAIGDINTGSLIIGTISDNDAQLNSAWIFRYVSRLRFID